MCRIKRWTHTTFLGRMAQVCWKDCPNWAAIISTLRWREHEMQHPPIHNRHTRKRHPYKNWLPLVAQTSTTWIPTRRVCTRRVTARTGRWVPRVLSTRDRWRGRLLRKPLPDSIRTRRITCIPCRITSSEWVIRAPCRPLGGSTGGIPCIVMGKWAGKYYSRTSLIRIGSDY